VVFYPLLCQFRHARAFFSIDSVPQLSKFGFAQFQIIFTSPRGFRKDPFTMNGVGRNRFSNKKNQLLSVLVFRDSTVQCQSNHPPKSVACRPDIGIATLVKPTPPDQLSEAQDLSKYQLQH
jgi:hypothetical protein